nr:unnamed protein product [Digitaria exilis]
MAANGDSSTGPPADVPTVLVKTEGVAAGEGSSALLPAAAPTINIPPLPLRCPPFPKSGKRKAVEEWNAECRRISKLATKDGNTIHSCCTGFIVSWNGTKKCARILTSSATVHGLGDHKPKLTQWYLLVQGGTGGPVIDHDGNVIGMAFIAPKPNILAISTILTCIEMWSRFSHIARPVHGLHLRTVELLEVSLLEAISLHHNIHSGYIVDKVDADSTAERLGIRYGDVIVSFDGLQTHTLPQLEDYLLSLGWKFLERSIDSSSLVDLTLEVYDLLGRITRNITLPVEFSDP